MPQFHSCSAASHTFGLQAMLFLIRTTKRAEIPYGKEGEGIRVSMSININISIGISIGNSIGINIYINISIGIGTHITF